MKITTLTLASTLVVAVAHQPVMAEASAECGAVAQPLLSVADYDADGVVTGKDVSMLARKHAKGSYASLYDRNADGILNGDDVALTANDMGKESTVLDQWITQQYNRFQHLQNVSGHATIINMGYQQLGNALQGHGAHWMTEGGMFSVAGFKPADQSVAEGINATIDGTDVAALFWGEHAVPLFEDSTVPNGLSTLDYPSPTGIWNLQRVQAFGDTPPDFIPGVEENWHTHAGTCLTFWDDGSGPEWNTNQYMSNAECQALPNLAPFVDPTTGLSINLWSNFWMLHVWLFDLNPNGVFANTHPCIAPNAPDEDTINDGREIPLWFQHHGGHS